MDYNNPYMQGGQTWQKTYQAQQQRNFNQTNSDNINGVSLTYIYQYYLNSPKRLYNLSYQDFEFLYTKWINEN
jgi:hypothetical protein